MYPQKSIYGKESTFTSPGLKPNHSIYDNQICYQSHKNIDEHQNNENRRVAKRKNYFSSFLKGKQHERLG